jgi:hypothetical protein
MNFCFGRKRNRPILNLVEKWIGRKGKGTVLVENELAHHVTARVHESRTVVLHRGWCVCMCVCVCVGGV